MKAILLLLILSLTAHAQTNTVYGKFRVLSTLKGSQPCPVMTDAQMLAIVSPEGGDCVYNSTLEALHVYNTTGTVWELSGSGGGLSEWVTATDYEVGDIIHESGRIYKALTLHTSGTFSTDLAATKWVLISDELLTKNQIDSTSSAIKEIQVPHKQFTSTASGKVLQETGNKNRLENPGFEATTVNSGWTSNVTSTAVATISTESVAPIEGKKSLIYSCAGGASGGTCTLSQDVATAYALQGLASIFIKSNSATGVKLFNRVNATNSLSINVDTITASIRKIPFVLGTTSSGLAVEITVAAAQTIEVLLDEGFVGAQDVKQDIHNVGPWINWTPTGSWSSNTTYSGKYRQVGDSYEYNIQVATTGAPTAAALNVNLPSGHVIDTTKLNSSTAGNEILGTAKSLDVGVNEYTPGYVRFNTTTNVDIRFSGASSGITANLTQALPFTFGNGDSVSLIFRAPIVGLSSSGSTYSSTNADTDWASCGHTTSSFTGFGTVTNIETQCKRQGGDLLMKGKFTSGTSTAVEARVALPTWNGSVLVSKGVSVIPTIQKVGDLARSLAGSAVTLHALIEPSTAYFTISAVVASTTDGITKANGNAIAASGTLISFNARIPINGWENSNQIIGSFSEIPTTKGSNGADIQSVYFGSGADCSTACTTGTCTICKPVGNKITSITFQSTGIYRFNGIDGTKYNCTSSGLSGSDWGDSYQPVSTQASTYAQLHFATSAGGAGNAEETSVICVGIP